MKAFVWILFLSVVFSSASLKAQGSESPKSLPESQSAESQPSKAKQIGLFPLQFPYYMLKTLTYPIHEGRRQVLRSEKLFKTLYFMSNEKKAYSVHPLLDIGAGSGFGGGAAFSHLNLFHRGYELKARYMIYTDLDQRASLTLSNPYAFYVGNRPFSFHLMARWWQEGDEDFYGIGDSSLVSNKSGYSFNDVEHSMSLGLEVAPRLTFSGIVGFDTINSGPKKNGSEPSVEQVFPLSDLPGFEQRITYFHTGFSLISDTRDNWYFPERGGLRSLRFQYFQGLGQQGFNYFQTDLDLRHYFQVSPGYVFILHNGWVFQEKTAGNTIPFYRLAMLDHNHFLRGFDRGRFRDRGSVIFNAEFRYPLWNFLDGTVFADTGRVFGGLKNFSFKGFKYTFGGGIRVIMNRFYSFRLEAGYGGEGANVVFTANQAL